MNNRRRRDIRSILDELGVLLMCLDDVIEAESEAYENMPESLQYSERGERMEEGLNTLQEVSEALADARDQLEEVIEG